MPTRYYNIDGSTATEVELLAPGSGAGDINVISIANPDLSNAVSCSLYLEDNPTSGATKRIALFRGLSIPAKTSLLLDNKDLLSFNNSSTTGFGLYITVGSASDSLDVIIK